MHFFIEDKVMCKQLDKTRVNKNTSGERVEDTGHILACWRIKAERMAQTKANSCLLYTSPSPRDRG